MLQTAKKLMISLNFSFSKNKLIKKLGNLRKLCYNLYRKEWEHTHFLLFRRLMKNEVEKLVSSKIKELNVFIDDVYTSTEEGKKIFNIVLDSNEVIDLNKITAASQIINKILDEEKILPSDIDELDIFSKEKGE